MTNTINLYENTESIEVILTEDGETIVINLNEQPRGPKGDSGTGGGTWGTITGDIEDQTDLTPANIGAASASSFIAGAGALTGPAAPLTIGTAAENATGDFATAAQGTKADTALQEVPSLSVATLPLTTSLIVGTGDAAIQYGLATGVTKATIEHAFVDTDAGLSVVVSSPNVKVKCQRWKMIVTETVDNGQAGTYTFAEPQNSPLSVGLYWTAGSFDGGIYTDGSPGWVICKDLNLTQPKWYSDEDVASPDLVQTWLPLDGATGTVTVTRVDATANQVLAALTAAGSSVSNLITFSATGDGTGQVPITPRINLQAEFDFVGQHLNVGSAIPFDVYEYRGPTVTDIVQIEDAGVVTPESLGLVIGTNVQAYDSDLTTWAGKTPYAGTITVTTGKTFDCTGNLTLSGTDGSTLNIGTGGTLGTAAYTASTAYAPADALSANKASLIYLTATY